MKNEEYCEGCKFFYYTNHKRIKKFLVQEKMCWRKNDKGIDETCNGYREWLHQRLLEEKNDKQNAE